MEARSTRKAQSDNYFEARKAMQQKLAAAPFSWLEVVEGKIADSVEYVIHASTKEASVPPFAVEVYTEGRLQSYETDRAKLLEKSVMPEEMRQRIVNSQLAAAAVIAGKGAEIERARSATLG